MTEVVVFRSKGCILLVARSAGKAPVDRKAALVKKGAPELKALLGYRLSFKVVGRWRKAGRDRNGERSSREAVAFSAPVEAG
jgi:hypothetical protein